MKSKQTIALVVNDNNHVINTCFVIALNEVFVFEEV